MIVEFFCQIKDNMFNLSNHIIFFQNEILQEKKIIKNNSFKVLKKQKLYYKMIDSNFILLSNFKDTSKIKGIVLNGNILFKCISEFNYSFLFHFTVFPKYIQIKKLYPTNKVGYMHDSLWEISLIKNDSLMYNGNRGNITFQTKIYNNLKLLIKDCYKNNMEV